MTDVTEEKFSLADLADLDVSEIAEIRSFALPAGVYEWECTAADLEEGTNKETGGKQFIATIETKVVGVKALIEALADGVEKDDLLGKTLTTRLYVNPAKPQEDVAKAIGRIRAFVTDAGMESTGKLGDIVKNLKGHTFVGKVVKEKDRDDKSVSYSKLKLDAKKK